MSGFKVLLAEDENITALQIKNKLNAWNFDVIAVASSGEEAVKIALEKKTRYYNIGHCIKWKNGWN